MKKETKDTLLGGLFILILIGIFLPNDEAPVTEELLTLGEYRASPNETKLSYIKKTFETNNWSEEDEKKYLALYYDCMGDFAYQKDPNLTFAEVFKWCDNERTNNISGLYSHINELDVRNNGNYKIAFDENIELLKKQKKQEATKIAIDLQEKSITNKNKEFQKHKTPTQALEQLGGFYTVKEISKNEVILYTSYYKNSEEKYILEDAKRNFIDGVFQSFIYTDVDFIKIGILLQENKTKEQHELSFQGSIKREDALKISQLFLKINKFDDLIDVEKIDTSIFTGYNSIANRARYNDQGTPTLDLFFQELSKVTY